MMCSKLLRHNPKPGCIFIAIERGSTALERGYTRALGGALRMRPLVLLIALGVAGASGYFFSHLKSELAPVEDRGVIRVRGTGPEGATLAYTSRYGRGSRQGPGGRARGPLAPAHQRQPRGVAVPHLHAPQGLGRARALAAGDLARDHAEDQAHRRRAGLRHRPRRLRPARHRAPDRVRAADLGHLRGAAGLRRQAAGQTSRTIPASRASTPT